jgi:hypothetical protein
MKKFTKISNTSVGEEKIEKVVNDNTLKFEILSLMDNFLEIKTYGNVSPVYMVPTKIEGKELFVEALMDFLQEKIEDKSLKILESLKYVIKDWKSIDEKIESIKAEKEKNILKKSVINTIDKYSDNKDLLKTYVLTKQGNINEKLNIICELLNDKNYIGYKEDLEFLLNVYKEKREF